MLFRFAASATLLSLVSAHAGCDGYQHGEDLYRREADMEPYMERLRARHPSVNARVLGQEQRLAKRASPTTYAADLLTQNTAGLNALSSGTGTNEATLPLPTTYPAGASSPVTGAQPLPSVTIVPSEWPALDHPPPTNSTEVQQWLAEIDLSGVPTWAPNAPGGSQNTTGNAEAIADAATRCWWTSGGCTRATDITYCPTENTWGLSYDDGPSPWTPKLLDYLNEADLKATIFTVGSRAISRPEMLQYEYMDGHQIAVHTWSHFYLTTLTNEEIVAELGWSKKAIYEITGVTPKYMRPPYGDIDDRVRYISLQMGLIPIIWTAYNGRTFDTQDWQIAGGVVSAQTVANNFNTILSQASSMGHGFIVLAHDLYQQSVNLQLDYVLPLALSNSALSIQPIINCLGFNAQQAYVETGTNSTAALTSQLTGASGTGFVAGLTTTPQALGGDVTVRPSQTGTRTGSATTAAPSAGATDAVNNSSSGAMALSAGSLLLFTAIAMIVLA